MSGTATRRCAAAHARHSHWQRTLGWATVATLCLTATARAQTVIDVPPDPAPSSISSDTILNLGAGGVIDDDFELFDASVLNVNANGVIRSATAHNSAVVNVNSGLIQRSVAASDNATVNVFGGTFEGGLTAAGTATLNVNGGGVDRYFFVESGATANITGGRLGYEPAILGHATISGGAFGEGAYFDAADLLMRGYDFAIDGVPVAGLDTVGDSMPLDIPKDTLFSGFFADGTPFAFDSTDGDFIADHTLTLERTATAAPGPPLVQVPSDTVPLGIGSGQVLVVNSGGVVPDSFNVGTGAVMLINGGQVGRNLEAVGATLLMTSGSIDEKLDVFHGTTATFTGGSIGEYAEVYDGGVLNVGGDATVDFYLDVYSGGTLNLSGSGSVDDLRTSSDASVNMSGGTMGYGSIAPGTVMNMTGGEVLRNLYVQPSNPGTLGGTLNLDGGAVKSLSVGMGGVFNWSGGSVGDNLGVFYSDVLIEGVDFKVDGVPVADLNAPGDEKTVNVNRNSMITGTLADGTPFVLSEADGDSFEGHVIFKRMNPTPAPTTLMVPGDDAGLGVRSGQTLTVGVGGSLPNNFNAGEGSNLIVDGGTVGENLEAYRAHVVVENGAVGEDFDAFDGSLIEVHGGSIGRNADVFAGATLMVTGGSVDGRLDIFQDATVILSDDGMLKSDVAVNDGGTLTLNGGVVEGGLYAKSGGYVEVNDGYVGFHFDAGSGSHVEVNGGNLFEEFVVRGGADVDIRGGTIGRGYRQRDGGEATLYGDNFEIDGVPVSALNGDGDMATVEMHSDSILTGILADGTPIAISALDGDEVADGNIHLVRAATAPVGPPLINVPSDDAPLGIRAGQTLVVGTGGVLADNFVAGPGSVVEINDGTVGENLEAIDADVFVHGGTVGRFVGLFPGSTMEVSAGEVGRLQMMTGASLTLTGGSVEAIYAESEPGTTINVTGGTVGYARVSGLLHVSGGNVAAHAYPGSHIILENGHINNRLDVDAGSVVDMSGGQMDGGVYIGNDAYLNVSGGIINGPSTILDAVVRITGGTMGPNWYIGNSADVDVDDGIIRGNWMVEHYGSLTIRGGDIGAGLYFRSEAEGSISGGNFHGVTFSAHSVAHFVGTNFLLDGQPIPGFTENGDSMRLFPLTAGSILEATLLDGRTWDMVIGDTPVKGMPFTIDPTTILWLTVVPEPTTLVLALSALPAMLLRRRRRLPVLDVNGTTRSLDPS